MHIALNGWFWDQPHTGSGQYVRHLLAALCEVAPDHRYSLVVAGHVTCLDGLPDAVDVLRIPLRRGGHLGKVWFEQRGYPLAVAGLQADVAHVPYWGPPLRSPRPVVCSVLDVIPLAVRAYRTGVKNRLYTSLGVAAARGAAHIIAISEAGRRDVAARIGLPLERITTTPLAASPAFHPHSDRDRDTAVAAKYGLDDLDDFVLYLGSYSVHKNVGLLLAAYTYVAQGMEGTVPLVLAGHTPRQWGSARFPDLPAYQQALGLPESQVRWIGPVDEADKPALYRLARVFAFPSLYEGFGLGPLEAMACGTPVVACDVSSVPEVTGDAAYLVRPNDSKGMGGAILSLLIDHDLANGLRERGLVRARAFSWQQTAKATLDVYARAISAP